MLRRIRMIVWLVSIVITSAVVYIQRQNDIKLQQAIQQLNEASTKWWIYLAMQNKK